MFQYFFLLFFPLNSTFEKTLKSSNFLLMDLQKNIFSNFKKNCAFFFILFLFFYILKKRKFKKGRHTK